MPSARLLLALLFACAALVHATDDELCTLNVEGVGHFDLRPLANDKEDYSVERNGTTFKLNMCRPVKQEEWNLDSVVSEADVGAVYRGSRGDFSMGDVRKIQLQQAPDTHAGEHALMFTMGDGSRCGEGSTIRASTAVRLVCSLSAGNGNPELVAMLPLDNPCSFFWEWRTVHACPVNPSGGAGRLFGIFAAIIGVALLAYLFAALLYNRYVLHKRGLEQLPSIPLSGTIDAIRQCIPRRPTPRSGWGAGVPRSWRNPRAGYTGLPTHEGESLMGDQRFSLEDDDVEGPTEVPLPPPKHANGGAQEGLIRL